MTNQEINEAVARKLGWDHPSNQMIWTRIYDKDGGCFREICKDLPDYSGSIAAVWEIVDHCLKDGWKLDLKGASNSESYFCEFWRNDGPNGFDFFRCEEATSAPLAICQAFLKYGG